MKSTLLVILSLLAVNAFGASIKSAGLDAENKNILINVTYGGGCGKHDFSLKLKGCAESAPVQCQADLIEQTDDHCEALLSRTVVISLENAGLTESYYKNGTLTIFGDLDWQTNQKTKATVKLP